MRVTDGYYYQDQNGKTIKLDSRKVEEFSDAFFSLFDEEEIHRGCTVQILHNTATDEYSFGWWYEEGDEESIWEEN